MVIVVIEVEVDDTARYKFGDLVKLVTPHNGESMGYIQNPVFYLPYTFRYIPLQDDAVSMKVGETVWWYQIELLSGKEITMDAEGIVGVIEDKEQDVNYLQQRIKELEERLGGKEIR